MVSTILAAEADLVLPIPPPWLAWSVGAALLLMALGAVVTWFILRGRARRGL